MSCRLEPVQVWPTEILMAWQCLSPPPTHLHAVSCFSGSFLIFCLSAVWWNNWKVMLTYGGLSFYLKRYPCGGGEKKSMQEITSQIRYFSYCLCSICPISGTIRLLTTCRHFKKPPCSANCTITALSNFFLIQFKSFLLHKNSVCNPVQR